VREILNRLFLASQEAGALLLFGSLAMGVNIVVSVYFSRRIGLEGIALGTTCGALVYVIAQVVLILTRHRNLFHRDLPLWLSLIAVASVISAIAGLWADGRIVLANARLSFLVNAVIVFAVFGAVIVLSTLAPTRLRRIYNSETET